MGIIANIKNIFGGAPEPAKRPEFTTELIPQPIDFTKGPALERQLGRLLNLFSVAERTQDIQDSIEAYQEGIRLRGIEPPIDAYETQQLIDSLKG